MTGTERSDEGLDARRRKLLFRAWHRGTREADLILGRFADATISQLTDIELAQLEQLMEASDRDLLAWTTGEMAAPAHHDTALLRKLRAFHFAATRER